jgi:4-amino-4-deoxy-L-arabinose transferase-like glycosyltransferase
MSTPPLTLLRRAPHGVLLRTRAGRRGRDARTLRPAGTARRRGAPVRRLVLGGPGEPPLARPLLWLLLLGTAALYLVGLTSSGYANEFYAAAVKSGTETLRAWLFGSLDAASSITVDKPPASLWVMVLFARVLGFSSFSLLLPQALMGVASVATLHATVKRWAGAYAGLVAGTLLALTPVAALMFRFDNPDAMLVLLMTLAAYAVVRALDATGATVHTASARGSRSALRWMLVAGALIGVAFLTKMAQGLLVLPAFGLVYVVAARLRLRTRVLHLLAATGAMVVSAGWYVALVELWPASARPYIGGSTNNSLWELALGYNGLGRIFSGSSGSAGGGGGGFGGTAGLLRLVNSEFATQISWLLPAALVALVAGLVLTRRASRMDRTRAALLLWGAWLVVTALVFSFMSGTIHPYYSVALAPAVAAVIAVTGRALWVRRESHLARGALALMVAVTAVWGFVLMQRDASGWMTWLAWTMLVGGSASALVLAVPVGRLKRWAVAGLLVGTLSALAGTASFTAATVASGHTGSTPTAGPSVVATSTLGGGGQGAPGGGQPPSGGGAATQDGTATRAGAPTAGGEGATSSTELANLLDATSSRWSAAVVGDQSAAQLILSSSTAVMAVGGWSGSDDSPTLAQFQAYVAAGDITYFIASGAGGDGGGGGPQGSSDSSASQITAWVEATFTSTTVGGSTVYDLTSPTTG